MLTLAQSVTRGNWLAAAWPWIALLFVLLIVGAVVLHLTRQALLGGDEAEIGTGPSGLTLQSLREMHDRGDLTDEEFEAAKKIVSRSAVQGIHPSASTPTSRRK